MNAPATVTWKTGVATPRDPEDISFVEASEEIQANSIVDQAMRDATKSREFPEGVTFREHAHVSRYFAVVKIYIRPEEIREIELEGGGTQKLYLPDTIRAEDKYNACVGLVIALGPQAFKDKDGRPTRSRYKIGDWVVFPRTDIIRIDFHGVALGVMTDDRALIVTDDPRHWTQGIVSFKA